MNVLEMNRGRAQGFMLLEAMIAVLIFSMGVLAVVGLQAAMSRNSTEARDRATASFLAQQQIAMIWSNPDDLTQNLEPGPDGTNLSALLPSGKRITEQTTTLGEFRVTVSWQPPSESGSPVTHTFTTLARVGK